MDGQAKIQLILELKNRMKTGLTKAKEKVNSNVRDMKQRFSDFKLSAISSLRSVAGEIPIIGRAFQLIKNPIVLATAGLIALGIAVGTVTKKAAEFEHAFLPIKQLNLDKSAQEMQNYQKQIKNAAFDVGANLNDSTNAIYDLQSGLGVFGKDAIDIFTKVGNYSLVTGANINDSTNSVVKAMKAFGLGVKDIDMLLASNAKTVQMGIVTFDELAKVQTEYAGAAATAGQSIDTANKLFTAFTSIAKDARTGATMTKTAFQGLTQAATIKGIEDLLGKNKMYDAKGNMRDMGSILKDLSAEFKKMSSRDIDVFINKVGGPEGLRAMFGKLKTGADDFFDAMEGFDKTEFNFAKALKNAKNDATTIAMMAKNRKDIIAVEIGQKFLPIWVTVLEKVNNMLQFVWDNFDTIWSVVKNVGIGLAALKLGMIAFNIITMANPIGAIVTGVVALIAYITIAYKKFDEFGAAMLMVLGPLGMIVNMVLNVKKHWDSITKSFSEGGFLSGIKRLGLVIIDALVMPIQQLLTLIGKIPGIDFADNWANKIENWRKDVLGIDTSKRLHKTESEGETETVTGSNPFAPSPASGDDGSISPVGSDSINKITGSAKQIRNITVNIDAFNKGGINTEHTELQQMDAEEIEEWFNNVMLRVIRNVELSY